MKYNEIFKLKDMLNEAKIPYELKELQNSHGYKIAYPDFREPAICAIETNFDSEDVLDVYGSFVSGEVFHITAQSAFEKIKEHYSLENQKLKGKLIDLLEKEKAFSKFCTDDERREKLADYLIENGVVINGTN